jgi:hypothetical protein
MAMPDFCLTSWGIVAVVGRCRRWRCGRRTRIFASTPQPAEGASAGAILDGLGVRFALESENA